MELLLKQRNKEEIMLEIRPSCEHCNKDLPNTSTEAMICTFECTYCKECAHGIFKNVYPNCSGNFTERPNRPNKQLVDYPVSVKYIFKPKDLIKAEQNTEEFRNIPPDKR